MVKGQIREGRMMVERGKTRIKRVVIVGDYFVYKEVDGTLGVRFADVHDREWGRFIGEINVTEETLERFRLYIEVRNRIESLPLIAHLL